MTNHLPQLTDEQRRENLKKATEARTRQKEVKEKLKDGSLEGDSWCR